MAKALKSMQELSDEDIPEVRDEAPRGSRRPSNTQEKAKEDVAEAVEKAEGRWSRRSRRLFEQANDANKRFEASTFVSRLKKAASEEQQGIAGPT